VHGNCFQTVNENAAAGIYQDACHKVLSEDLNMSHVTQHSAPLVRTPDKHDDRMNTFGDLIDSADIDGTFLSRIMTEDETWRLLYDPQLRQQSATWKSPREKKPLQERSKGKIMLERFSSHLELFNRFHPRKSDCKQAPVQADPSPSTQFNSP
jgi:hypothetical protein